MLLSRMIFAQNGSPSAIDLRKSSGGGSGTSTRNLLMKMP